MPQLRSTAALSRKQKKGRLRTNTDNTNAAVAQKELQKEPPWNGQ